MTGLQYDPSRKTGVTQTFLASQRGVKFICVPYNVTFELNIISKLNDDSLQIIEQILLFQPSLNITINLIGAIGEKKDVIVMESITQNDQYEGGFDSRRLIITLRFTAKTYLFGPVAEHGGLIKRVDVTTTPIQCQFTRREYKDTLQHQRPARLTTTMQPSSMAISTKVTKSKSVHHRSTSVVSSVGDYVR